MMTVSVSAAAAAAVVAAVVGVMSNADLNVSLSE